MRRGRLLKGKRGSYTVFAVMAFSAMLLFMYAALSAANRMMVSATGDHLGRLWGTSLLAEYDLHLQERYGLYGFYADEALVNEKLDIYARFTFDEKPYIRYDGADCSLDGWQLTSPDIFKKQVAEAVLFQNKPHPMTRGAAEEAETFGQRYISSQWILQSLPSAGNRGETAIAGLADAIKSGQGLSYFVNGTAVDQYLFTYFRHQLSEEDDFGDTYFRNEIEYVLTGQPDDVQALKQCRRKLEGLRNLLNLSYLYGCAEKREAVMAIATALTPGPEAVLTQAALMELWAYAEAKNDAKLLLAGEKVPLLKGDENWALTIENVLDGQTDGEEDGGYIAPPVITGQPYEAYLRILVSGLSERTKLLRAMDLVQINMKYLYCDYFLLSDYYTGVDFTMKINGVDHGFQESYGREPRD